MSEICEEHSKQSEILNGDDPVNKTSLISNNSFQEPCETKETKTHLNAASPQIEISEKSQEEAIENVVESKSDESSNSVTSSAFGSSTNSESVSNSTSPSKNDENNDFTNKSLEGNKKEGSTSNENIEITIHNPISCETTSSVNGITNLDPSRIHSTSTVSLYEETNTTALSKTNYSRSVDNVSTIHNSETNKSSNDLDAKKILSEFSTQKTKVAATQKITPAEIADSPQLPKDIISQDLGSIVKNVHGIFSSVSGSIKNAYNISHNYRTQKQPAKPIKVIPNNRILNQIFDEDVSETNSDNTEPECQNLDASDDSKEGLEKVLEEQRREMAVLKERVRQQAEEMQSKELSVKDMEAKMEVMRKRLENAEREKDAAVMRYAGGERAAIDARRCADAASRAEKAALGELELVNGKLKSAHAEKQRICRLYDDKCHELLASEREAAKLREDAKEAEGRLKWTQSKLRMEMDAYKESAEKVERLEKQVAELEAGGGGAAKQLDAELKESQAALILCRHEKEELERRLANTTSSLEACEREREGCSSALSLANQELKQVRESNLRLEQENAELAALRAQAARAHAAQAELDRQSSLAARAREAAALQHAARLTEQHAAARAQLGDARAAEQALTADNASLREKLTQLEEETCRLSTTLAEETERRNRENRMLARKVAELTEELAEATKKLEWEKGENCVLQKKHASAIKELNRELQRALKRCDQLEAKMPAAAGAAGDQARTGSISSLSSGESSTAPERLQNGHATDSSDTQPQAREPDRQALIERIVSLQRAAARRAERTEFLEEHCRQLTADARDKARVLRRLLCDHAPPAHVDEMRRDIARLGGGTMSSVWGDAPADLPRDLCVEMARRLEAVLQEALLKNICLKENVDTLSKEIERLKSAKSSEGASEVK